MARHTLLIDADDTLWENNIFFEKAIDDFVSQLEHLGYTRNARELSAAPRAVVGGSFEDEPDCASAPIASKKG